MAVRSSAPARVLGAVLSCLMVLGLAASAANAGPPGDGASIAVSGVFLLSDGRVEVRATVTCPTPTPDSFSGYEVHVRQGERSGTVHSERAACSGARQRWSVVVASSDGSPFDGPVVLSFLLRTDCSTAGDEIVCGGTLQYHNDVPMAVTGETSSATPALEVRRLRLRSDGQVDLRSQVRCDRNTADDFSIVSLGLQQTPFVGDDEEIAPFACTGRAQHLRHRFASSTDTAFTAGPARLFVQVLSDCREEPFDDGEGTYAWCLSLTAYDRPVVLRR